MTAVRPRRKSIRRQMLLLIAISLATLVIVQGLYLTWFSSLTKQRAVQYAQDSLAQVAGQLESMAEDVRNIAYSISFNNYMQEYLTTDDAERKYLDLYPVLAKMLEFVRTSNNDVYDILLFDLDGHKALSSQQPYALDVLENMEPWQAVPPSAEPVSLPAIVYGTSVYYPYVQTVFGISGNTLFQEIGSCVVLCNGRSVQGVVGSISISEDAELLVVDSMGTVLASNSQERIGQIFERERFQALGDTGQEVRLDGNRPYIVQSIQFGEWAVFSLVPVDALLSDWNKAVGLGLAVGVAAAVFLLLAGISISRDIHSGVDELVRFMQAVSGGDEGQRVDEGGLEELGKIAGGVNQMLDRMDAMTTSVLKTQSELYEAQLLYRKTQFTALQRQINPHFLFNTLHCMASIGALRNVPEIVTIASAMANIFRYCIKGADIVAIEEELDCVEDYLTIIDLRYGGKIRGVLTVEPEIRAYRMPKMILQPIVENAVFHGLEPKRGGGEIHITGRLVADEMIEFRIEDDGKGVEAQALEQLRAHLNQAAPADASDDKSSIGLQNILGRIRFLFGARATIEVRSQEDEGTSVRLCIPAEPEGHSDIAQSLAT